MNVENNIMHLEFNRTFGHGFTDNALQNTEVWHNEVCWIKEEDPITLLKMMCGHSIVLLSGVSMAVWWMLCVTKCSLDF